MSDKSKICQSCGRFSEEGWAILEDNIRFWTCPRCMLREVTETVEPDYEAAERAIDNIEVFTASDGKPGLRMVTRSQSEIARLAVNAALGIETP